MPEPPGENGTSDFGTRALHFHGEVFACLPAEMLSLQQIEMIRKEIEGKNDFPLICPLYFPFSVKEYSIQKFFLPLLCFFWKTFFACWHEHCPTRRGRNPALSGQVIPVHNNQQILSAGFQGVHFCIFVAVWKGSWESGGRKTIFFFWGVFQEY